MSNVPRRCHLEKYTPAELAIREAIIAVEAAGADVRLTRAVMLLVEAKDRVADFVDGIEMPTPTSWPNIPSTTQPQGPNTAGGSGQVAP